LERAGHEVWEAQARRLPFKQKLRTLQNAVGYVTELAYVKQISDQGVVRGNQPLAYEGYMELLSACSTHDKKIELPGKQKRAIYAMASDGGDDYPYADNLNAEHEVFQVDADINDIIVHATNTSRFLPVVNPSSPTSCHVRNGTS
jgi:hypothetical protein